MTHFSLDGASLPDNLKIYLDGEWTHHALISEYELHYNQESHVYEADILLKQGYYSYQYVCVDANGKIAAVQPIEGNFWQTENEYTLLVYYRAAGARYDRLVGWRTASYRP